MSNGVDAASAFITTSITKSDDNIVYVKTYSSRAYVIPLL